MYCTYYMYYMCYMYTWPGSHAMQYLHVWCCEHRAHEQHTANTAARFEHSTRPPLSAADVESTLRQICTRVHSLRLQPPERHV